MSQSANEGQEPQGNGSTSGQGQEPPANTGQGQEPQGGDQSGAFDLSTVQDPATRAYLEQVQRDATEARNQAARYRTERNQFRDKVTEQERANETEQQRAAREQQERDQETQALREENRNLKVGNAVRAAATTAKAFNADTVWAMVRDQVETDEAGKPTNVDALLKDLRKTDPYLFKRQGAVDAGEGGDEGPGLNMNDAIRRAAGKS